MKRFIIICIGAMLAFSMVLTCFPVLATQDTSLPQIVLSDGASTDNMLDGDDSTFTFVPASCKMTVSFPSGIRSLYLEFNDIPGSWIIKDTSGKTFTVNQDFLHQFISLQDVWDTCPGQITIIFSKNVQVNDLYAFSTPQIPNWVQIWQNPCEKVDLMLLSTHSDDDELFFAGILPLYTSIPKCKVQVVFLTMHPQNFVRRHEMLNGLWTAGVTHYPVMGTFPDFRIDDLDKTLALYNTLGYTSDDFYAFGVEQLRRFRPQVVVTHDINGEYGHGMHRLSSSIMMKSIGYASNPSYFPKSAKIYGTWATPKLYLHLYPENPVKINVDQYLPSRGMTAFQVSQQAFLCHKSQLKTCYRPWLMGTPKSPITESSQIKENNPAYYGLYRSLVGNDTACNDFLENIKLYADQPSVTVAPTYSAKPIQTAASKATTVTPQVTETPVPSAVPTETDVTPSPSTESASPTQDVKTSGTAHSLYIWASAGVALLVLGVGGSIYLVLILKKRKP